MIGIYKNLKNSVSCRERLYQRIFFVFLLFYLQIAVAYGKNLGKPNGHRILETNVWLSPSSDFNSLEKQIVKRIQKDRNSVFDHYLLSHLYMRMFAAGANFDHSNQINYLRKAIQLAKQAISLDPKSELGYIASADIFLAMNEHEKATAILRQLNSISTSKSWRSAFLEIRISPKGKSSHGPSRSEKLINTLFEYQDANNELIAYFLTDAISVNHDTDSSLMLLRKIDKKTSIGELKIDIANNLLMTNEINQAANFYEQVLKLENAHYMTKLEARLSLAIINYSKLKNYIKAINLLEEPQDLIPNNNIYSDLFKLHLGASNFLSGNFTDAHLSFMSYFENNKSIEDINKALSFLHSIYRSQEDYHNKLAHLLTAINHTAPGHSSVYILLGHIQSEQIDSLDKAIEAYMAASVLSPTNHHIQNSIGIAYYQKKEFSRALLFFDKALDIYPSDPIAMYNKACVFALLGESELSLQSLAMAVALDPSLIDSAQKDSDFDSMRSNSEFKQILQYSDNLSANIHVK